MAIIFSQQQPPAIISIPKYTSNICPFCDCEKDVRLEIFELDTGKIIDRNMSISSYRNLIQNNTAQPDLVKCSKIIECYCPQCYICFSIAKSVGIW